MKKKQMFWARSAQQKILNFNPQREAPKTIDPRHEVPPLKNCPSPIVSCRIAPYRRGSHRIVSHRIVSCHIAPYRIVSECIVLYRVVSYRIVSYRFVSCACVCVLVHEGALAFLCACVGAFACICAWVCAFSSIFLHRCQGPSLMFPRDLASSFPGT